MTRLVAYDAQVRDHDIRVVGPDDLDSARTVLPGTAAPLCGIGPPPWLSRTDPALTCC
jgi:hypothetical protein